MERLQQLINQLQEQFDRKVDPSQMLQTIRLLEAELALISTQAATSKGSAKVAVMMPSSMKIYTGQAAMQELKTAAAGAGAVTSVAEPSVPNVPPAPEVRLAPDPGNPPRPAAKDQEKGPWPFDPLADIPTFAHQEKPRELNDVIGNNNGASLNDRLRSDRLELKAALNDTPVRDLKKAIGINDRFVFINQLFRGDEVMYERSLKTINSFRILPEAEYWMERELKVKLGWDESRETTKHFYQLVRRRFS
ncbi:MAG TPA: hypothetical protein VHC48_07010 [Puia sp.]|nr:hypothetical protein [Puia sp.]